MTEQMSAKASFEKAVALDVYGHVEEALAAYEQTIHLDPGLVEAHYNKGQLLRRQGRFEEALTAYDQVIRLDPSYTFACRSRNYVGDL